MTDGGKRQAGFVAEAGEVGGEGAANGQRRGDVADRAMLQGLFEQKVPVGAFVSQNDLVRLLGIPVQPLRDALRVLEAEGVLTIHPRSGIQFLKPDLELARRSEEHTSELQSLMRISYAVFCLKKNNSKLQPNTKSHLNTTIE